MKKAQMEIFGLAIVVVIIIFGLLFFFSMKGKNKTDLKQSYTDTQLAQNMLNAMFKTDTDGCGLSIKDVAKFCANGNTLDCGSSPAVSACDYLKNTIEKILDETLVKWNRPFYLTLDTSSVPNIIPPFSNLGCDRTKERESPGQLFIPADEKISVRLDICK